MDNGQGKRTMTNSSFLVVGNQITLYIGSLPDLSEHAHSAAVIVLSLNCKNISVRSGSAEPWKDYQAFFLPADEPSEMRQHGNPLACIFIEPESHLYQEFLQQNDFSPRRLVSYQNKLYELRQILNSFTENPTCADELCATVTESILELLPAEKEIDQRVMACVKAIKENIEENLSSNELAKLFGISERQLSTLFKRDMGLPIRKYRLWLRLKNVVQLVSQGGLLTDAAVASGFSDSAHFANSCRKLLGLKPSDIMLANKSLSFLSTSEFV